jgi:hypothetical protein
VGRVGPPFGNQRPAPPPGPVAPRGTGPGLPGRCPSRQPLPRPRAAGSPCGRLAPPPGQHFGFPAGGRKRIPHPKGNNGKHIGKIVSLPPRTPPRPAAACAGHRPGGGGGSGLGKGTRATAAGTPRRAEQDPPWAPRPIRADHRTDSISVPGSFPIVIVQPHNKVKRDQKDDTARHLPPTTIPK